MTPLTRVGVAWEGLFSAIDRVTLNEWNPGPLKSEKQFRDSLLAQLRLGAPPAPLCRIEKEYRDGGTTADIYMKWQGLVFSAEIYIELKLNLTRKTDFDRLVGQIHGLEPAKRKIVVVLCGETDPALLGRLKELFTDHLDDSPMRVDWYNEPSLKIIQKPVDHG